jgi:predicted ester cyclase
MESRRAIVESFYANVLSKTASPELEPNLERVLAPGWESIGDYSGAKKSREQFLGQLRGFGRLIPDLAWKVEELIESPDRIVARGRASGTPVGELFGVPPSGKRFEIMSIDVHTVEGGQIVRTHHVEDWATALRQLRA